MARILYVVAGWLLLPLFVLRLAWRGVRQRGYWMRLGERFGCHAAAAPMPTIWLHAVSVGETRACIPLVAALRTQWPGYRLLLTHGTPTGFMTGRELFGEQVQQAWVPFDELFATRRFVRHFRPALGLVMETEIWPNLFAACRSAGVPLVLVNARMSERSARRYRLMAGLARATLAPLCAVAAQTGADAERLRALGAQRVSVTGNLKFDIEPPAGQLALGERWRAACAGRTVWLAASTREGEEALLLDALQKMATADILLVLVPRHPQRFDAVARLIESRGLAYARRSVAVPDTASIRVWLGDSMGEMFAYYRMADLALIGGSLLPFGGQNLIEAAATGCPVMLGPHRWNFARASQDALDCGAAAELADPAQLAQVAAGLLADAPRLQRMRAAALVYSQQHRGAVQRVMPLLTECLRQEFMP